MRGWIAVPLLIAATTTGCGGLTTQEYTSTDGRYRVLFSGEPKIQEKPVAIPGGVVVSRFAISEDWFGTARMVMYVDYPAQLVQFGNKEGRLEGACQGMLREAGLSMLSKTTISMNGHPGREVSFESQPGSPGTKLAGRARICLVGNPLYQVFIAGKSGSIQSDRIREFLNSFKLLDQTPAPAETRVAGGPPPVAPSPTPSPQPAGRPAAPRPGPRPGPDRRPPTPPGPASAPSDAMAFYEIPEPASAPIEAAGPATDDQPPLPPEAPPSPLLRPASPGRGPTPPPEPTPREEPPPRRIPAPPARTAPSDRAADEIPTLLTPASGGATLLAFDWVGRDDDYTGTDGRRIAPGGGQDEHFRLVIEVPAGAIIEEVAILGGPVRWTTKPLPRSWPLAVVSNQQPKNVRQSLRLGPFSGRWTFDLYAEPHESLQPGQALGVEVVLSLRGTRHHLTARCQRK